MIFIINKTKEKATISTRQESNLGYVSIALQDKNGNTTLDKDILVSSSTDIIAAMGKRFPNGIANLSKPVNIHDFYIQGASISYVYQDFLNRFNVDNNHHYGPTVDYLGVGPLTLYADALPYEEKDDVDKKLPKNLTIFVTDVEDDYNCEMVDKRNLADYSTVTIGNYKLIFIVCRWSNWSKLRFPTALKLTSKVGTEWYRLGVNNGGKRPVNDLIPISGQDLEEFLVEEENARRTAEEERKQNTGWKSDYNRGSKPPYNNRNDGNSTYGNRGPSNFKPGKKPYQK